MGSLRFPRGSTINSPPAARKLLGHPSYADRLVAIGIGFRIEAGPRTIDASVLRSSCEPARIRTDCGASEKGPKEK